MPADARVGPAPAHPRPDLDRGALLGLLAALGVAVPAALIAPVAPRAGAPVAQSLAIAGALLLLVPVAFAVLKRSGGAASPPAWFVLHVLASAAGCVLVAAHAGAGSLLSPPGLLLALLLAVIVQGLLARALLAPTLATRFAASPASFAAPDPARRDAIARIIAAKSALLPRIDPQASEALFSPALPHWLHHPGLCLRYRRLAAEEAALVGARARAGRLLAGWRGLHMAAAWLFVAGLALHVVVVTFFAGYAADGGPVDWWHVTAWGGP